MSSRRDIWQKIWKAAVLAAGLAVISPARGPALAAVPAAPNVAQPADALVTLDRSMAPLEQYFNQGGDPIRFLALLSPT